MKKEKTYCVHIYPRAYEYEDIQAKSADEAERIAVNKVAMSYDDIDRVEVMRECACGTDNDLDEKVCGECGKKI